MLEMLLWFCVMFMANPHVTATAPGDYVEAVKYQYDNQNDQTYMVIARYNIDSEKQTHMMFMQPRHFAGKPSEKDMLKTIVSDSYITTVGLEK